VLAGPIRKISFSFFTHYEGIRIALPLVARTTVADTSVSAVCIAATAVRRDRSNQRKTALPAQPQEVAFYQKMFAALQRYGWHIDAGAYLSIGCERRSVAGHANRSESLQRFRLREHFARSR